MVLFVQPALGDSHPPPSRQAQASSADVDFSAEAVRFAEANPRVDLGRDSAAKVKVKSIADIGQVGRSGGVGETRHET